MRQKKTKIIAMTVRKREAAEQTVGTTSFYYENAGVKASQTERSQKRERKQSKREMNEVKRNFVIRQK